MLDKSFPASNYVRSGSGTYTVVYVKLYTHTVRYVNASTGAAVGSCTVEGKAGQRYSVTAPSVTGMTPTKSVITGSFGSGNTSETVYYYPNIYTVIYDANGGSGAPDAQSKEHGQTLTLSKKTPTRYGYRFLGWSRNAAATTASFLPGGSYTSNAPSTLYAVWDPERFTVTLDANGGRYGISVLTKRYGQALILPSEIPVRDGYVFLGWGSSRTSTTAIYSAGGKYTPNASGTLYAVWERIPERYTVYFNANGGTNAPAAMTKTEGVTLMLPTAIPSRTGYAFLGWSTSPTSQTVSYIAGDGYTEDASVTLYAIWAPYVYTVRYDANGGSGAPGEQNKTHDIAIALSFEIPYREHYRFLGWSMSNTAAEPTYYPGDGYDDEGDATLYAVWEYINYDFSVSELTVVPGEVRQYETVQIHFRLDSWDRSNAYEEIPVEVILNGTVIYSTTVSFSVYGGNNVDFDLHVGGLEGIQTLTVWVNQTDYLNETRTGNNTVSAAFTVNKIAALKTSYAAPNADYTEGNEVVTSFYVTNGSPSAIVPKDGVNFTFEVYRLDENEGEVAVYRDTWEQVVIPGNSTNLVYFKWTVPADSAGTLYWCRGSVNENRVIAEDDLSDNRSVFSRYSRSRRESQTPNTGYQLFLDGHSLIQIAEYLTESPYKTYRGNDIWKKEEIRYILTNEKYVGDIILQKTFIPNCIDKQTKKNRGELPKYLVSNNHPGIIDRDTFNVVQVEFASRSSKKSKSSLSQTEKGRYSARYALTDILICGSCGSHYKRTGKTDKNGKRIYYWRCMNRMENKAKVCQDSIGAEETKLHAAICRCLSSMMACKNEVVALMQSNLQYALTGNNAVLDTVAIEKQIETYYDQMGTLVERSASTSGDTDLYDREIKKICEKIEALRKALKTEQSKSVMTKEVQANMDRILGYLSGTDERSFLTYDDVTIRRLVECIVVHPEGKISVTLKGGFQGEEKL